MFYYEEMSVREIAETLGCSENTVKSRLNYGRRKVEAKVKELEKRGTRLYSMAPLAVGICISSTLEQRFQQTMIAMRGKFVNITKYPMTCVMLGIAVLLILGAALSKPVKHVLKNSKED